MQAMISPAESEQLETLTLGRRIAQLHLKFGLPVRMTRRRLREVHAHADKLFKNIDGFYQRERKRRHRRNITALVYILLELCQDGILCDKMVNAGLLSRIVSDSTRAAEDKTRYLQVLALVARRGSHATQAKLCRETPSLIRQLSYDTLADMILIIAHCIERAMCPTLSPDLMFPVLSMDASNTALAIIEKPDATLDVVLHSLAVATLAPYYAQARNPTTVSNVHDLFAALTRSRHIFLRVVAVQVFRSILTSNASSLASFVPPDRLDRDGDFRAAFAALPPDLQTPILDYGYNRCALRLTETMTYRFRKAVEDLQRYQNLYNFATEMAAVYQDGHALLEKQQVTLSGRPPVDWSEYIPVCMRLLRNRGGPEDVEVANIIQLEYLRTTQSRDIVSAVARRLIQLFPQQPHAYSIYCGLVTGQDEDGPDMARRGLACPRIPLPIRLKLLMHAVDTFSAKGWRLLLGADNTDKGRHAYGAKCLKQAMEYAREYLKEAPPDAPARLDVLSRQFLNTITMHGPELKGSTLLQDVLEQIERTERLLKFLGCRESPKQSRDARELFKLHYRHLNEPRWGPVVDRVDSLMDDLHSGRRRPCAGPGDDEKGDYTIKFAGWSRLDVEVIGVTSHGPLKCRCEDMIETEYPASIMVYSCSLPSCRRRTAILKKCGRCQRAVYCNEKCQRADRERHQCNSVNSR
ncbi:hypothetical protein C8Q80DRAFT_756918 [Daedaleopsis nitida]|nr:hypothetical protein C8Q80DRAFT_756918 [Daedaleopsis nitida]